MFAQKPGKGITLEMYIRNTQVNKKKKKKKKKLLGIKGFDLTWLQGIKEPLYTRELLKCKIRKRRSV